MFVLGDNNRSRVKIILIRWLKFFKGEKQILNFNSVKSHPNFSEIFFLVFCAKDTNSYKTKFMHFSIKYLAKRNKESILTFFHMFLHKKANFNYYFHLLYIYFACLFFVCPFVSKKVKPAKLIRPKFCAGPHMTPRKVYECSKLQSFWIFVKFVKKFCTKKRES